MVTCATNKWTTSLTLGKMLQIGNRIAWKHVKEQRIWRSLQMQSVQPPVRRVLSQKCPSLNCEKRDGCALGLVRISAAAGEAPDEPEHSERRTIKPWELTAISRFYPKIASGVQSRDQLMHQTVYHLAKKLCSRFCWSAAPALLLLLCSVSSPRLGCCTRPA